MSTDIYGKTATDGIFWGPVLLGKNKYAASADKSILLNAAKPFMIDLCSHYKATANLFIMEEDGMPFFVHQLFPPNCVYVFYASVYNPLYCTATGKLALLYISREAREDYLAATELVPMTSATLTSREALMDELEKNPPTGICL